MARNRPRRDASRLDTTSAHGGSPGERKVYITEEFDSTGHVTAASILSQQICLPRPAGMPRRVHVALIIPFYVTGGRAYRPAILGSGRFPPTWFRGFRRRYLQASGVLRCGQDNIINSTRSTFGIHFPFTLCLLSVSKLCKCAAHVSASLNRMHLVACGSTRLPNI